MGLLKKGLKYGAIFGVAHEMGKAYENRKNAQTEQQQPISPNQSREQIPRQQQYYGADGYYHQSWCNGQCYGQCTGNAKNQAQNLAPEYASIEKQTNGGMATY